MYTDIPIDSIYKDVHDIDIDSSEVDDDVLSQVALWTLGEEDYNSSDDPIGDTFAGTGMSLCYIDRDSVLSWCLARYIGEMIYNPITKTVSEKWRETLRGCYFKADRIYFAHGCGYDWIDADLLGGSGDGSTRETFEKGLTLTTSFPEQ